MQYFNQIEDTQSGDVIFTLPDETPCPSDHAYSQAIPFALSPDRTIYAINGQYSGVTQIFDATTGELIARTNAYASELAFNDDGTRLIARSCYAILTWNVPQLIEQFAALNAANTPAS